MVVYIVLYIVMNKKLLIIFLSIIFLGACNKSNVPPTDESSNEISVTEIKVVDYLKQICKGDIYDESSVSIEVIFSDSTSKIYCGDKLSFDYSDFDAQVEGDYVIIVKINELNVSVNIGVEVVKKTYKILIISNSYGDDIVQWAHEIADSLGIDFTIANLYIGGCVLENHLKNLQKNEKAYTYVTYDKNTKIWNRISNTSIKESLECAEWNYVCLQQGSKQSGIPETYDVVDEIMNEILKLKDNVKFILNMTWAYQQNSRHKNFSTYNNDQMTMYNAILNAVKTKIIPNKSFVKIVPVGTAIQNTRTSFIGDKLCRDSSCHLT